jgi:uncharacterized membrane protein HdeD (DUF308 family)
MNSPTSVVEPSDLGPILRHEAAAVRGRWIWLLAIGIALVVLGVFAISAPLVPGLSVVLCFGVVLMAAGISQAIAAFWTRNWSGFFVTLLAGIFYFVVGFVFVRRPLATSATLTLMIAAFLMVGGIFKIVTALVYRFAQWGWVVVSGIVAVVLGDLILSDWPESSLVVIGTFLGIEMIFNGWSWIMMSLVLRRLPKAA